MVNSLDQNLRHLNHRRIILFRRWRLRILKLFLDQRIDPLQAVLRPEKGREQNLRIIILRIDGKLGDSITSTYLLNGLKMIFPKIHISVVSAPEFKSLFWGLADDYLAFKLNFLNAIKFVQKNNQTYDVLINTSHILSPSSIFLSRFIPATKKISFLNQDWKMFSNHVVFDLNNAHITERYNALLRLLSPKPFSNLTYSYPLDSQSRQKVYELLAERRIQHPFKQLIIVNSFAGARRRNLSLMTMKALITQLSKALPECLIVSIGNVGDLRIINRWHAELQNPQWTFFNYGSLDFNAALVAEADLVISPDTSIVHMACAFKKKLVAIFREDYTEEKNRQIWEPFATQFRVVEAPKISSQNEDGDINTVNVTEVIDASIKLLSNS